jgi:cell division protein ZapA (FtsZ GTPase activity inhibitor)
MPENNGSPTLGEVARRLDEAIREMRETRREMADSASRSEATYLRKSEFLLSQQTDASVIRGLENEVHSTSKRIDTLTTTLAAVQKDMSDEVKRIEERRRTDRMWLVGGLAFPLIIMLVAAVVLGTGP